MVYQPEDRNIEVQGQERGKLFMSWQPENTERKKPEEKGLGNRCHPQSHSPLLINTF